MSKLKWILLILVSFQSFSYDYYKDIELSGKEKYKEMYITEDIYSKSKRDLKDIRIIDEEGTEVPYVIEGEKEQYSYIEKIVSNGEIISVTDKEETTETVIKFTPKNQMEDLAGNRLEIIPTKNFYFEYELLGSSNGKNWESITYGELYKTPERENLLISFSESRYSYYKIITELSREKIFKGAVLKFYGNEKRETENFTVKLLYTQEEKEKNTLLTIESRRLPLKKITLKAEDEFKRNYSISGEGYGYGSGTIFRVGEKENLTVTLNSLDRDDKIFLEIKNGDSRPLKIQEIIGEYIPDKIMFKAEEGKKYRITFGDDSLYKPRYDIAEFSSMIKDRDVVKAGKLFETEKEVIPEPKDYSVYYNIFIGIIVLLLIVFMAGKISKKK